MRRNPPPSFRVIGTEKLPAKLLQIVVKIILQIIVKITAKLLQTMVLFSTCGAGVAGGTVPATEVSDGHAVMERGWRLPPTN